MNNLKNITTAIKKFDKKENKEYFDYLDIHKSLASVYGIKEEDIIKVEVSISENQERISHNNIKNGKYIDYWGLIYNSNPDKIDLIQPSFVTFGMQFVYGFESLEEKGRGRAYRLKIKEII